MNNEPVGIHSSHNACCYRDECRKQANRISELEKDLALKTRDRNVFRNFTLAYKERIAELERCAEYYRDKYYFDSPAKTLTDEEIEEVFYTLEYGHTLNEFARAILKKAREK